MEFFSHSSQNPALDATRLWAGYCEPVGENTRTVTTLIVFRLKFIIIEMRVAAMAHYKWHFDCMGEC